MPTYKEILNQIKEEEVKYVDVYREAWRRAGLNAAKLAIGGPTQAKDRFFVAPRECRRSRLRGSARRNIAPSPAKSAVRSRRAPVSAAIIRFMEGPQGIGGH